MHAYVATPQQVINTPPNMYRSHMYDVDPYRHECEHCCMYISESDDGGRAHYREIEQYAKRKRQNLDKTEAGGTIFYAHVWACTFSAHYGR